MSKRIVWNGIEMSGYQELADYLSRSTGKRVSYQSAWNYYRRGLRKNSDFNSLRERSSESKVKHFLESRQAPSEYDSHYVDFIDEMLSWDESEDEND